VQLVDDPGAGTPERETDHLDSFGHHDLELGAEGVVVPPGLPEADAQPVGLGTDQLGVVPDRPRIRGLVRAEDIDAERRTRQLPRPGDGGPQQVGWEIAGGKETEGTGTADRGG